jgi:ComF family protein
VYPESCLVCEGELTQNEEHICSICSGGLEETSYHLFEEPSDFDKLFWGRTEINATFALYFFKKRSAVQTLLFNLKYKNNAAVGKHFGGIIGKRLLTTKRFNSVDLIIPVPLHHKKEFIRGYNQSDALANGIASELGVSVNKNVVARRTHTQTQTRKSRFQRWENVNSIFHVKKAIVKYEHVLIVDDVVTTGSTIESMVQSIKEIAPNLQISVVTLAIA